MQITVNLKLLKEKLLEIEKDGMDLVSFRIVTGLIENKTIYPTFLHLEGISKDGRYKDYESIDEPSTIGMFINT